MDKAFLCSKSAFALRDVKSAAQLTLLDSLEVLYDHMLQSVINIGYVKTSRFT